MLRVRRKPWFVCGLLAGIALSSPSAHAQYTSDFQTNLISGVTSNWSGSYIVGSNNVADVLRIDTGGTLSDGTGYMGYEFSGSNNIVMLAGTDSVWKSSSPLYVGYAAAANQLIITNLSQGDYGQGFYYGGVYSSAGYVGYMPSSSNNIVLIAGTGTFWDGGGNFYVGYAGAANQLIISNVSQGYQRSYGYYDGAVYDTVANVGFMGSSSNNLVLVSGTNSAWDNSSDLTIGASGSGNQLIITNGGFVGSRFGYLGFNSTGRNNRVWVSGSGSIWRNNRDLVVGQSGRSNCVSITDGGVVSNNFGYLGYNATSSNNSVLVTGTGSIWNNASDLYVGRFGAGNTLVISNGGKVVNNYGFVGSQASSSNNSVRVTGTGSVWIITGTALVMGFQGTANRMVISDGGKVNTVTAQLSGRNNSVLVVDPGSVWSNGSGAASVSIGSGDQADSLVISNGGQVVTGQGYVGSGFSSNNTALITGSGSVWSADSLTIGDIGWGNSLEVSNGGQAVDSVSYIGFNSSTRNNTVRVVDGGVWQNNALYVGYQGSSNSLVVAGGSAIATGINVGLASAGCDNLLQLDSGSVSVTNATHDATLEVRNGVLIINGGVLQADRFVMTNGCGLFVRNGGTVIVSTIVLDPNRSAVGDGIPNGWKQQYGLDPLDSTLAGADSDGDGFSNLQEYLAGTDPTNSASNLRITSIAPQGNGLLVTWTMGAGKTNALQATGGVGYNTNGFSDIFVVTNTVGTTTNYLDVGGVTNVPSRYYRVRLVP